MWIPCWLRRVPLLVLVFIQSTALVLAQDDAPAAAPTKNAETETAADRSDDSDWAVDLAPQPWELPEMGMPAWDPDLTTNEVRADGSSLAEQATVVNSLSSGAEIDTSMHTFYAVMAVLVLLAGGICCLQLSN